MTFDICTEGFFETVVEKLGIIYEDFKLTWLRPLSVQLTGDSNTHLEHERDIQDMNLHQRMNIWSGRPFDSRLSG